MALYDSVGTIVSDAAAELGLGTVTDTYGSTDANVIQLRTLLKSAGRDLVADRAWTHLTKEYAFVTWENWKASTAYFASGATPAWADLTHYSVGDCVSYTLDGSSNLYRCTVAGTSRSGIGPIVTSGTVTDGTVTWQFLNSGLANIVTRGRYYYTCTTSGTSGTVGPTRTTGTNTDGSVTWTWTGTAADYALPSGFSELIDQTGWNRTNRLPVGGPLAPQEWQYLKGRQQGVVFNVLFRPVAGLLRLYPDTDTPGGYAITFEYTTSYWVSTAGGTTPTADAPTANTDLLYFDTLLLSRRLKLDWLKAKGFDTSAAQDAYDKTLEDSENADGSAPVLSLRGARNSIPLVGVGNVPPSGFGS